MSNPTRRAVLAAVAGFLVIAMLLASALVYSIHENARLMTPQTARTAATPTSTTIQYTPTAGTTVTVTVTPTQGSSTSPSSTPPVPKPTLAPGATPVIPPRVPTPEPTATATPIPGVPTATPAPPTPTATVAPTATTAPTATATSVPLVDAAMITSISPSSLTTGSGSIVMAQITMVNVGTSTWGNGYGIGCLQGCSAQPNQICPCIYRVPPRATVTESFQYSVPTSFYYTSGQSIFQVFDGNTPFGNQAVINYTIRGWSLALHEASPTCEGDGASWTTTGTGSVACSSGGLDLSQGGPSGVGVDLHATPGAYDPSDYYAEVHVHFTSTSPSLVAGFIVTEPTASGPYRQVFVVSPSGMYCINLCVTNPPGWSVSPSSDYDISVSITQNGGLENEYIDGANVMGGGITSGGLIGLIEAASAGSTDVAEFSNYRLYQWKP